MNNPINTIAKKNIKMEKNLATTYSPKTYMFIEHVEDHFEL